MSYTINNFITSDSRIQDGDKKLSICLSANGFSFSVISASGKLLAICDLDCDMPKSLVDKLRQLREIFAELNISLPNFGEIEVIETVSKFTWIPEHLYKNGSGRQYLQLVCTIDPKDDIEVEYSEKMQAYCVFVTQSSAIPVFKVLAPKMKHRCQHAILAESSHLSDKSKNKPVVAVNVREGFIDVVVFDDQKLLMDNTYVCTSKAELVFIVLNLIRNLQLRREQVEISLSGAVDREWYQYISPYFTKTTLNTGRPVSIEDDALRRVHIYKYALTIN